VAAGPEIERALRATLLWSAKEAVMKALREGLRLPPATVEVEAGLGTFSPAGWRPFSASAPTAALGGCWRPVGELVLTVAGGAPEEPALLAPAGDAWAGSAAVVALGEGF